MIYFIIFLCLISYFLGYLLGRKHETFGKNALFDIPHKGTRNPVDGWPVNKENTMP